MSTGNVNSVSRRCRLGHRMTLLPALLITVSAGAAEIYIGHPAVGDHRVDICLEWGMQCDGEAAHAWCKAQGYDRAIEWETDHDIGATHPTMVLSSSQVAVSEQDVHQATAAVVGVTGLALVHAPPGKWRLYAVNHSNPQQIGASPGQMVDVPAGKDGTHVVMKVD